MLREISKPWAVRLQVRRWRSRALTLLRCCSSARPRSGPRHPSASARASCRQVTSLYRLVDCKAAQAAVTEYKARKTKSGAEGMALGCLFGAFLGPLSLLGCLGGGLLGESGPDGEQSSSPSATVGWPRARLAGAGLAPNPRGRRKVCNTNIVQQEMLLSAAGRTASTGVIGWPMPEKLTPEVLQSDC